MLGVSVLGLLDSGAARTVLGTGSKKLMSALNLKLRSTTLSLKTAGGEKLDVLGTTEVPITFNGETKIIPVMVAPSLNRRCILGYDFWQAFGIRPTFSQSVDLIDEAELESVENANELTENQKQQLEDVKRLFLIAAPEQLGKTSLIEHIIELKDEFKNADPVRKNPYPWSPEIQKKIHRALDNMIRDGVVEPSESDWALPVVPVKKRDTEEVRLCLDARKLNERTKRDAYPLPHQNRILSQLGPFKYLSTIDLSQAFLQVPLNHHSRRFTAFSVPGKGLFQFTRLPFGLVNSPATLSKLMDKVLGHGKLEPAIFVYLDDIVVASHTFEEHIQKLRDLARRLKEANLFINLEKSKFCCHELPYLGYILSEQGLRPNPDRVQAILGFEAPTSVRSLRRFLGMVNYYRRFINNFSELTAPLTDLLKNKPKRVRWNEAAENAFRSIKERLISAPVMANPDFSVPFCVQTDASDTALAGILTQVQNGVERVIAYHSEKLKGAELNYHAAEKEGLAALRCIEKFRCYIEGTHFTLVTDSSALSFIMRAKWRSSSRLSRWSITLQQYDMDIRHRKGKENIVPDALSRSIEALDVEESDRWYRDLFDAVKADPEKYVDFRIQDVTQKARSWYMEVCGEIGSWTELVRELKREFLPVDIDYVYERQAGNRKQGAREKFQDFYLDMVRIFRSMSTPWDEKRKFDVLFRNTREDCRIAMLAANVDSIPKMRDFGKRFDSINWHMYQKRECRFTRKETIQIDEVGQQSSFRENRGRYHKGEQPKNVPNAYQSYRPINQQQQKREWKQKTTQQKACGDKNFQKPRPNNSPHRNSVPCTSGTNALERIVKAYIPLKKNVCFNCHEGGHSFNECEQERKVFCERCGFPGFPMKDCPYCELKNGQKAV